MPLSSSPSLQILIGIQFPIRHCVLTLVLTLLAATPASSADFQKGMDAYNKRDYETALKEWERLAEQGNARSMFHLADMYENAVGVPRDSEKAMRWARKSAELGYADAQYLLSNLIASSTWKSTPSHNRQVIEWITLAAEQGHIMAQSSLGTKNLEGLWTPKNYRAAIKWLTLAAEQGEPYAMYNMGDIYAEGKGVIQNYSVALKWYTLAAEQGKAGHKYGLGIIYQDGIIVPKDYEIAIKWFKLAAEQGDIRALEALGRIYWVGKENIPMDLVRAHMWFNIYATLTKLHLPSSEFHDLRDEVAKEMTTPQIKKAQKLADEWWAKNGARLQSTSTH